VKKIALLFFIPRLGVQLKRTFNFSNNFVFLYFQRPFWSRWSNCVSVVQRGCSVYNGKLQLFPPQEHWSGEITGSRPPEKNESAIESAPRPRKGPAILQRNGVMRRNSGPPSIPSARWKGIKKETLDGTESSHAAYFRSFVPLTAPAMQNPH